VPSPDRAPPAFTFHGRRNGRPLNPSRARALAEILPRLRFALTDLADRDPAEALFGEARPLWLEIGFGTGEHLAAIALRHPDIGFIGAEPFVNGVSALCKSIKAQGQTNIRIYPDDVRFLLEALPAHCLERCYLLFPDPWPKARHAERRFIGPVNLTRLARVLRPGGLLHTATDDTGLARWMLFHGLAHKDFAWTAEGVADWARPPPGWVETRYQGKALKAGRQTTYLTFERKEWRAND